MILKVLAGLRKTMQLVLLQNDWILIIDSDEVVDAELWRELKNKKLDEKTVYKLNFKAFYKISSKTLSVE